MYIPTLTVSPAPAPKPAPEAPATSVVVPVKIYADKYQAFLTFIKDCPYNIYQEGKNDLFDPNSLL
jgi:hypothetical protein